MINCPFYDDSVCLQASSKAGFQVTTYEDTCKACLSGIYVTDGLITVEKHKRGDATIKIATSANGPGTELKKIISWIPAPRKKGCASCIRMVARMNRWGPEGCKQKMDYILKKLEIAAKRRGIPFSRTLTEKLVMKAINKATPK